MPSERSEYLEMSSDRRRVLEKEVATLKTKLAMRDQQLRDADAALAAERVKVDDLRLVAMRADMQRMALAERLGSTEPEIAPEPWEAIVTAAIRWRRGADRGELAAAVDAFTGEVEGGGKLRPEQYADGAGAQAWRQAMGGKPVEHHEDCTQYDPGCTNTCPVR